MDLLTVSEAAEALRCSPSMVRKQMKQGGLAYVAIGTRKVIRREDLEGWIRDHLQKVGAA